MIGAALIVSIVPKGKGNDVLEASVKAGAHGGTVFFGRGAGVNERQTIFGMPIMPEKEIVFTIVYQNESDRILAEIVAAVDLEKPGAGMAFVMPVSKVAGVAHLLDEPPPPL
ncbi:MAG: P-II family nitrogen regulator [Bauldia sp.]|nr:P-II family nitrogen regulator [Bauldia sp.]